MTEHQTQQRILLAMSRGLRRLWRNNVGKAWRGVGILGERQSPSPITAKTLAASRAALRPGDLVLRHPRLVTFGLCEGSSDLIGYTTVEVTPDMVGQRLAVFTAIEVKSPTGRPTAQQTAFIEHVRQAGGRSGIARNEEDAERITGGL